MTISFCRHEMTPPSSSKGIVLMTTGMKYTTRDTHFKRRYPILRNGSEYTLEIVPRVIIEH